MTHPGYDSCLCPSLDWDAFCPCDSATSDRRRVLRDGACELLSQIIVRGIKREKPYDRSMEVIYILGLHTLATTRMRCLLLSELFSRSLCIECLSNTIHCLCIRPNSF